MRRGWSWVVLCCAVLAGWSGVTGTDSTAALAQQAEAPKAAARETPAPPVAKPGEPGTKSVVRFEMLVTNHMLVEARINDKGPFHLIFDLGAPITLLNNRASEAAGVVKPGAPRSFLFGMRGEAVVDRLKVGRLNADKLPVIVLDHPVLKALEDVTGRPIDGIMGFTFFARFKTTIDYHAREMTFEPITYEVRDLLKELPDRLMRPKVAERLVLAPSGLWGLQIGVTTARLTSQGVPIVKVLDGSPADMAGLKSGDLLCTVDGRWITSIEDVYHAAGKVKPSHKIDVLITRDGKEQTLSITPSDGI
jgi:PDZ domain/Aspartyl protease